MERLLIEFTDLNKLLDDGPIIYPIRLNAHYKTDPAPPVTFMHFYITVQCLNPDGTILSWTHRHAQTTYIRDPWAEKRDKMEEIHQNARTLKSRIETYILQKTGIRTHNIRPGHINTTPKEIRVRGHLPDALRQKEAPIEKD